MTDVAEPVEHPVAPPHERPGGEDKLLPIFVYGLYLLGPVNGLTILIGLILAYGSRAEAGPINASHFTFAIRSFWLSIGWFLISAAIFLVGLALLVVIIGIPILIAGATLYGAISVWFMLRAVVGLIYLVQGEAYPRPRSWLI